MGTKKWPHPRFHMFYLNLYKEIKVEVLHSVDFAEIIETFQCKVLMKLLIYQNS